VKFVNSDDEEEETDSLAGTTLVASAAIDSKEKNISADSMEPKLLFTSDDENDDVNLNTLTTREAFTGASGADNLALQKRIGGDVRFRLDDRFADSDLEDDDNQKSMKRTLKEEENSMEIPTGDNIDKQIQRDTEVAKDILMNMFGNDVNLLYVCSKNILIQFLFVFLMIF